jgi:ABC-type bacteriocin/lantibiotic exporter with double-glycine peptidase domain
VRLQREEFTKFWTKKINTINDSSLPDINIKNCDIKFENISFNYLNTKEKAIKNINLENKGKLNDSFRWSKWCG